MARVKAKEHEKLDSATITRVVQALDSEKPITKKVACEMLNISYNTSRLKRIIEQFQNDQEFEIKRRKQLRGKPFDELEIRYTILNFLKGDSIAALARSQYRTADGIKKILKQYNIPAKDASNDYFNPTVIPDEAISEEFNIGELAWSARYNCVAIVDSLHSTGSGHGNIYGIWVFGKHNEQALQPAYELGKLEILKELGVTTDDFEDQQTTGLFYSIR
jgi:hypothetical protein